MKRVVISTLMGAAMLIATAPKAEAALVATLRVCQGATCTTFGGVTDSASSGGVVSVGDYTLTNIGGSGLEIPGLAESATSELQARRTADTSTDPLVAWLTVTGYTQPAGAPGFRVDPSLAVTRAGLTSTSQVDYDVWISLTNATGFPPAGSIHLPQMSCTPPGSIGGTSCDVDPGATITGSALTYSLVTRVVINSAFLDRAFYGTTATVIVTAVPEPGSMMLLGTGLLGLAAVARRRYAKK